MDRRVLRPRLDGGLAQCLLTLLDGVASYVVLDLERQAALDGLQDPRRAAILPRFDGVLVVLPFGRDVRHRSTPGAGGHLVFEERPARDQQPARARPADELVGREEDRIHRCVCALGARRRVHVDLDVRPRASEIEECEGAVRVQELSQRRGVGAYARDVGARGERADLGLAMLVLFELALEHGEIRPTCRIFIDGHHRCNRLPPPELVGVVLERPVEDHRSLSLRDLLEERLGPLWVLQPENAAQLIDRAGAPMPKTR
eukprot:scaffold143018_cov118-Phaeocystis_antarctica.AAC.1